MNEKTIANRKRMPITARPDFIAFIILLAANLIAFCALFRAGILYHDDIGRAVLGYNRWSLGNRYLNDLLVPVVFGNENVINTSPLPQLIAVIEMTFAEIIVVRFNGDTGYAPDIRKTMSDYKILKRMGMMRITSDFWGGFYAFAHYGSDAFYFDPYIPLPEEELPVLSETALHTISGSEDLIVVTMKKEKKKMDVSLIHDPVAEVEHFWEK